MANLDLAFVSLFWDLMNRKTGDLGRVEFRPQKPAFDLTGTIPQLFPRSTPEEQGVDSAHIAAFVDELRTSEHVAAHQLMILRHGHVIYEGGFDPYHAGVWHVTYSMCKSITGMAIGLLIDDGLLSLDSSVTDILLPVDNLTDTVLNPMRVLQRTRYYGLTVRHLLTMQSGSSYNEIGAIAGNDWIKGFFDAGTKFRPGERFDYNSMNSYILSAIVTRITGKSMFEFLKERLFEPMGIERVFWEASPEGITKAGWGLFILQEDVAKLAQLYLNKGQWNGQQLISAEWVTESTRPQVETGQEANPQYGYHIWMSDVPGSYFYNGMLGQNAYIYPDNDMIIVINAGNDEVFAGGTMTHIVRSYWGKGYTPSDAPLPQDAVRTEQLRSARHRAEHTAADTPAAATPESFTQRLRGRIKEMICGKPEPVITPQMQAAEWVHALNGCTYVMESQGVGLFPLMMQVAHYNYTQGIRKLRFRTTNDVLHLEFLEGTVWNTFPVGMGKGRHGAVVLGGEEYLVGCRGRIGMNEDDEPVLTLRIAFIEEACERLLKIVFHSRESIELFWSEDPGKTVIGETLEGITKGSGNINPIVDRLLEQINPDLIVSAMQYTMNPHVKAVLETAAEAEDAGVLPSAVPGDPAGGTEPSARSTHTDTDTRMDPAAAMIAAQQTASQESAS